MIYRGKTTYLEDMTHKPINSFACNFHKNSDTIKKISDNNTTGSTASGSVTDSEILY